LGVSPARNGSENGQLCVIVGMGRDLRTDIIDGRLLRSEGSRVHFIQMRDPMDAQSVVFWGIALSLRTFRTFINNRLPDRQEEFNKWYRTIQDIYNRVSRQEQIINIV
jgi:hypothetical protein